MASGSRDFAKLLDDLGFKAGDLTKKDLEP